MIGYQLSLPRSHDAVLVVLNRSASPAQSESAYVNTEPAGALWHRYCRKSTSGFSTVFVCDEVHCKRGVLTLVSSRPTGRGRVRGVSVRVSQRMVEQVVANSSSNVPVPLVAELRDARSRLLRWCWRFLCSGVLWVCAADTSFFPVPPKGRISYGMQPVPQERTLKAARGRHSEQGVDGRHGVRAANVEGDGGRRKSA